MPPEQKGAAFPVLLEVQDVVAANSFYTPSSLPLYNTPNAIYYFFASVQALELSYAARSVFLNGVSAPVVLQLFGTKIELHGLSTRANYTD
jgi:hypothetical protein